jgi:methionyl-tRNA formyltransferase
MRLVFMGSPEFAVMPLSYLHLAGYEVAAVYTKPDKPSGRGLEMNFSAVKRAALLLGLPVIQPKSFKKPEAVEELAQFKPYVIVVAAYGQILPQSVLDLPRYGCLNIHPSLLPRHRGAAPVVSTLLAGDKWGGTTIMLMDEGLDTGPVLARASVLIREEDTAGSLADKLSLVSSHLLLDVLPAWVRGQIKPQPQGNLLATYSKTMGKEAGEIDWALPALEVWRRVRAFQPWPGAFTRYQGRVLKIIEAKPAGYQTGEPAGKVITLDKSFGICTGDGVLEVLRVQIEGKQVMSAADFQRGQRGFLRALLPN